MYRDYREDSPFHVKITQERSESSFGKGGSLEIKTTIGIEVVEIKNNVHTMLWETHFRYRCSDWLDPYALFEVVHEQLRNIPKRASYPIALYEVEVSGETLNGKVEELSFFYLSKPEPRGALSSGASISTCELATIFGRLCKRLNIVKFATIECASNPGPINISSTRSVSLNDGGPTRFKLSSGS